MLVVCICIAVDMAQVYACIMYGIPTSLLPVAVINWIVVHPPEGAEVARRAGFVYLALFGANSIGTVIGIGIGSGIAA